MNAVQIKQELLSRPSLIDGRALALRIIGEREKCQPAKAEGRLAELTTASMINDLFKRVMPKEFKARGNHTRIQNADAFWKLLGFPVNEEYFVEQLAAGHLNLDEVPIYSMSPHICLNCQTFQSFPLHYQLALLLLRPNETHWGDLLEESEVDDPHFWSFLARAHHLPESLRPAGTVSTDIFDRTFAQHRSPLRWLPLAQAVTNHNTGSVFLDINESDEDYDGWGLDWSAKTIEWLRADYWKAKHLLDSVEKFGAWLKRSPNERVAMACRLYQRALKLTNDEKRKQKQRIRVGVAAEGRALVGIL